MHETMQNDGKDLPARDAAFAPIWERVKPYTMTSEARAKALFDAVNHVVDANIPGAFVECGVWKGGSSMLIALTLLARGVKDRDIVLIDTFDGMTEPGPEDTDLHGASAGDLMAGSKGDEVAELVKARAPLDAVKAAMHSTGYPQRRLRFAVADARTDLPKIHTSLICLLRLDTDFYDSTLSELVHLYPRVSLGAPVIIDDYGHWQGCQRAFEDYFDAEQKDSRHIRPLLWQIDYTGRGFIKPDKPLKADIPRYDYVPAGMVDPGLLDLFPSADETNPWTIKWRYLRPKAPHKFRTDARNQKAVKIGYASYEEAVCLHNLALPFAGKRGLEIGSHFGWTSAHLRAAGLRMDYADIAFADPVHKAHVKKVLDAVPSDVDFRMTGWPSPDCIDTLAALDDEPWSFVFIDGNHDAPYPAQDAEAVLPHCAENAVVVFHDLVSPDVAAGLEVMREAGWRTKIFNTMQILGVAWRGDVSLPTHHADPNVPLPFHPHLEIFSDQK